MLEEYRNMQARMAALSDSLAAIEGTGRSADGAVTATVRPGGELVRLSLDRATAARPNLDALLPAIVEASRLAVADARAKVQSLTRDLMPERLRHLVADDGTLDLEQLGSGQASAFAGGR